VGGERKWRKDVGVLIWWKNYVLMYANGKMRSVETVPGVGEGNIQVNDGGYEFNHDIFKNIGKCHNVPLVQ
jgi:hypothetical protein